LGDPDPHPSRSNDNEKGNSYWATGGLVMKERICQLNAASVGQPTTTITLAVPVNLLKQVEETAELEGCDVTTIINCLVQEGLNNSSSTIKRMQFADHAKDVLINQGIEQQAIDQIFNKLLF
jgi:hypothetical protein